MEGYLGVVGDEEGVVLAGAETSAGLGELGELGLAFLLFHRSYIYLGIGDSNGHTVYYPSHSV